MENLGNDLSLPSLGTEEESSEDNPNTNNVESNPSSTHQPNLQQEVQEGFKKFVFKSKAIPCRNATSDPISSRINRTRSVNRNLSENECYYIDTLEVIVPEVNCLYWRNDNKSICLISCRVKDSAALHQLYPFYSCTVVIHTTRTCCALKRKQK